ncbi:RNA polymerase sigma factor [Thermodesulfobacteriota bacterium]
MAKKTQEEDFELIAKCLAGDARAAETFVRRYSDIIYRSLQHTLIEKHIPFTREDLKDLHNTVFLQLFDNNGRKLRQFKGKNGCSLATWIKIISVRSTLNFIRKKGHDGITGRKQQVSIEDYQEFADEKEGTWTLLERSEKERLLRNGTDLLSARYKLFFKLHFDHGLTIAEIADALQLSIQNAYTLKHRLIQKLKSHIISVT